MTQTAIIPDVAQRGRMFLGTFDDSVSRSPWGFLQANGRNLTNTLVYHALLGPRLCSRIGNVLYHKPYFDAFRRDETPLMHLAATGFFQFHMKGESFNDTIERRRSERTNSTLAWIETTEWSPGSDIFQSLEDLQRRAGDHGVRQYSPSFHKLFQTLADRALPEGTPEYREIHSRWTQAFQGQGRTRSEFEKLCDQHYGPQSVKKLAAMSTVNSVNHYAYALAMDQITRDADEIPIVETKEIVLFNSVTRSLIDSHEPLSSAHLDELINGEIFELVNRNFRVPLDLFHEPKNWAKLADLVGMTNASSEMIELKRAVLLEIRRCLEGGSNWRGPLDLERACREYSSFLRKEFGRPSSTLGRVTMKLGLDNFASTATKNAAVDQATNIITGGAIAGASVAGLGVDWQTGAALGGAANWVLKNWVNLVIDFIAEPTAYHTRRIVDRVRRDEGKYSNSSKNYADQTMLPLIQALCVKQITSEAAAAAHNNEIEAFLDAAPLDPF